MRQRISTRLFLALVPVLLAAFPAGGRAQAWPAKPIRWIIPYAPGGSADSRARQMSDRLARALGAPIIADNRAGGGGVIGTDAIAKALPDGYTIGMGNLAPLAVNPHLQRQLPYDPLADFAPVTLIESGPLVLMVHPGLGATSVSELIALARRRPGELTFASSGPGGAHHLSGEMFKALAGIDIVHVPYKGGAPAASDLLGGHVSMMFEMGYAALPSIRSGKLRPLAVTAARRLAVLPQVPTMAEAGVPGFESSNWQGVIAPAATPPAIVSRLAEAFAAVLRAPEIRELIVQQGNDVGGGTPAEFAAWIRAEHARWGTLIRSAGIQVN